MPTDLNHYEAALTIDRNALDSAVIEQPTLFYEVAELAASARDELEGAKGALDHAAAETANDLRKAAEIAGSKTTEARISEQVTISGVFVTAEVAVREAKLSADRAGNLKEAYSQRASMLKLMVDLYASNYFSVSSMKAGGTGDLLNAKAATGRRALTEARAKRGVGG